VRRRFAVNKFGAVKTVVGGISFDSKAEARRYLDLKMLQDAGIITDLDRQVPFSIEINGRKICKYLADFTYKTAAGEDRIEDVKGYVTPVYRLKKKLVEAVFNVRIIEVK